jgi:hypothetical protein
MNKSNKKWEYRITTSTIWLSFDYGEVYADSREEALELAKKEITYNLKKANEILNSCDPPIGFKIEMDLSQIELHKIDKELSETDYVIWDKANDHLIRFEKGDDIVIFGSKEEAEIDCYGNEYVTKCTDLPLHHKKELLRQINK